MEQNEASFLREIHKLTKENNILLHKINQRDHRMRMWKTVRICITLALLFGAYYVIQPLVENLTNAYSSIQHSFEELQKTKDSVSDFSSRLGGLKKDTQ